MVKYNIIEDNFINEVKLKQIINKKLFNINKILEIIEKWMKNIKLVFI